MENEKLFIQTKEYWKVDLRAFYLTSDRKELDKNHPDVLDYIDNKNFCLRRTARFYITRRIIFSLGLFSNDGNVSGTWCYLDDDLLSSCLNTSCVLFYESSWWFFD